MLARPTLALATGASLLLLLAPSADAQRRGAAPPAGGAKPPETWSPPTTSRGVGCSPFTVNLCVPLDGSFQVVDFNFGSGACERNDDGSGQVFLTGWTFEFYGTPFSDVFVNNNGNVSFGQGFSTFSPAGFPLANTPMIAPFWGDVDTRADDGTDGVVWFREWSTANGDSVNRLVVTWDHVGYYNSHTDELNTFQVILTDGNDPLVGIGNNVCFCYDDMAWTTGDASGGSGGFGGAPATVGANEGNGTDFFQVGRFDHAGSDYDGPGGNVDGVDFLDGQTFCFDTSSISNNTPPVFVNPPTDLVATVGVPLNFSVDAIGPEVGETVTLSVDAMGLANFSSMETPGNPATSDCTLTATIAQLGTHVVEFTAVDDGVPPLTSRHDVTIRVEPDGQVGGGLCDPNMVNSTGLPATLWSVGSDQVAQNLIDLHVADLPTSSMGYFITSQGTGVVTNPGVHTGVLCIADPIMGRYDQSPLDSGTGTTVSMSVDLVSIPQPFGGPIAVMAGETWGWQYFYRDGGVQNFSNAVRVTFQ